MDSSPSDLDALRAAFDGDLTPTIGVEEEYFVLHPETGEPAWDAPELVGSLDDARYKQELPAAQLEHLTVPCADLAEVERRLVAARRDLAAAVPHRAFAAAGTHPTAARIVAVPEDSRYHETLRAHAWAARQQMVGALQVHVAIRPAEVALAVHDALRSYLPDLVAISAASPFWAGEDTGLAAVRPLIGTLLPRQGVPPAFRTLEAYAEMRRWMRTAEVDDERRIWWEVRLRPLFGTLEIRAMDSQPTAGAAIAISTLAACLAVWLADRVRDGQRLPVHATERIAENRWRALHGGRHARLADLDTGEVQRLDLRLGRLLEQLAPTAEGLVGGHLLDGIEALLHRDGADAQREAAAERGVKGVPGWLAEVFAS